MIKSAIAISVSKAGAHAVDGRAAKRVPRRRHPLVLALIGGLLVFAFQSRAVQSTDPGPKRALRSFDATGELVKLTLPEQRAPQSVVAIQASPSSLGVAPPRSGLISVQELVVRHPRPSSAPSSGLSPPAFL